MTIISYNADHVALSGDILNFFKFYDSYAFGLVILQLLNIVMSDSSFDTRPHGEHLSLYDGLREIALRMSDPVISKRYDIYQARSEYYKWMKQKFIPMRRK